jgi:hypothetical protein
MSQHRLPGRISFLMALALAIGSTCAPAQPRSGPPPSTPGSPGSPPGHGGLPLMAPPKPYKPVAVTLPQPYNDPNFEAFRKELGEIASHKVAEEPIFNRLKFHPWVERLVRPLKPEKRISDRDHGCRRKVRPKPG